MPDAAFELDRSARWAAGGRVLLAGEPLRLFRFSERGASGVRLLADGVGLEEAGRRTGADLGRLARRLLDAGALHPRPSAGPFSPADVEVVVPVRDRAAELGRLLDRLAAGGAAVVVVDDGSTDGSGEVARGHGARVVSRAQPGGPAAARNLGWRSTDKGAVLAFVDSDCLPDPDWLERLLPHFADPEVGAVAPRLTGGTGTEKNAVSCYDNTCSALDLGPRPAAVRPGTRVSYVPAAALVVRRAALEAVGGFDEALPTGEDVDLVWRLADAGWTVRYDPSVTVAHGGRTTFRALAGRRFAYGTSAGPLARRHPGRLAPVRVPAWSVLAWAPLGLTRLPLRHRAAVSAGVLVAAGASLHRRLRAGTDVPLLAGLVGRAHLAALRSVRDGLLRPYAPLSVALLGSRRARPVVLAAAVTRAGAAWWPRRRVADPATFTLLRLGDDLAYSLGVWWGCLVHRTAAPLLPRIPLSGWARP
jgi:mycofactocin system glycosyltransferase